MVSSNLKVELDPREDSSGQIYYIGRLRFSGTIDLSKGATFLIFTSEDSEEQLQVAVNNSDNTTYSKYTKKNDRLKISLDARKDQYDDTFFVAKIQMNGYIRCDNEVVFLVFLSRINFEELQVVGEIVQNDHPVQKKTIEVYQGSETKSIEL